MFTGLIQQKAKLVSVAARDRGLDLSIERPADFSNLAEGESIAVDGACLTLVKFDDQRLEFFVGAETMAKTTLATYCIGQVVNLERSLALGDRLGGHMVSGHVDGTGILTLRYADGECLGLHVSVTRDQLRWVIPKGSVCLNGVSLTVNEIDQQKMTLAVLLIPETLARTNLGEIKIGDRINVEFDQNVKIIAHQLSHYLAHSDMLQNSLGPLNGAQSEQHS